MFWSFVRPDRILPPITRSAAVTASLEADELAVGIDHLRVSAELLEFDDSHRLFWPLDQFPQNARQGAAPWPVANFPRAGGGKKNSQAPKCERGGGRFVLKLSKTFARGNPWGENRKNH